jgi:hypothetical protein
LKKNSDSISQLSNNLTLYDKRIDGYTHTLGDLIGSTSDDYQKSDNKNIIDNANANLY